MELLMLALFAVLIACTWWVFALVASLEARR